MNMTNGKYTEENNTKTMKYEDESYFYDLYGLGMNNMIIIYLFH